MPSYASKEQQTLSPLITGYPAETSTGGQRLATRNRHATTSQPNQLIHEGACNRRPGQMGLNCLHTCLIVRLVKSISLSFWTYHSSTHHSVSTCGPLRLGFFF